MICLLSAVPFLLCLPIGQKFKMYKCVANINQPSLHSFNTQILLSFFLFFSFSFSVSPSFCPSLFFYLFPFMPISMKSPTFWRSLWVNKDKILIESFVCVSIYPLIFYIFSDFYNLLILHKSMCVCVCHISSSSCRAGSTDIPNPLSPLLPIVHRPRQVFRTTSRILT